ALQFGDGRPRRGQGVADSRRSRLHAGEPDRAPLPRCPGRPDLGGHFRDPARRDRRPDQEARPWHLYRLGSLGLVGLQQVNKTHAVPAPESTGYVEVEGGRIWYRSNGDRHKDKAPILCVHGGPGVPHEYLLPLTTLSFERRVILYDQLDVGRSDKPNDAKNWTVQRFVSEIDAVRNALGLDEFHLFGNSWGGTIVAEYAIGRPKGMKSLTLEGPLLSTA